MGTKAEFFNVQPVSAALELLFHHCQFPHKAETLDPRAALGRVLAAPISSPLDLPEFRRSTVDGYAVRAADTYGASPSLPAYLNCVGVVSMGEAAHLDIGSAQAVLIHTGGMLPASADAVVMVERTQSFGENEIEVLSPVAPGENVVQVGEDVRQGEAILSAGHRLRAQDIGALLAVGVLAVEVIKPPRIGILSSGDELVPPEKMPTPGQIRDLNSYTLAALVCENGGEPTLLGLARDDFDDLLARAQAGLQDNDLLVISAGSSVSARDLTCEVVNRLGTPGLLQHGLAVKPGKPTIIAACDGKPVIGLPGNPVSALLVARQIVVPLIRRFLGEVALPVGTVTATLAANVASTAGREDSVPVRLIEQGGVLLAEPVFGKSNLIFTLVRADGLVHVPLNSTGLKAGTVVEVTLI